MAGGLWSYQRGGFSPTEGGGGLWSGGLLPSSGKPGGLLSGGGGGGGAYVLHSEQIVSFFSVCQLKAKYTIRKQKSPCIKQVCLYLINSKYTFCLPCFQHSYVFFLIYLFIKILIQFCRKVHFRVFFRNSLVTLKVNIHLCTLKKLIYLAKFFPFSLQK